MTTSLSLSTRMCKAPIPSLGDFHCFQPLLQLSLSTASLISRSFFIHTDSHIVARKTLVKCSFGHIYMDSHS